MSRLAILIALASSLPLRADGTWSLARDGNLEVYSHRGPEDAAATLLWIERLRALVKQHLSLDLAADRPVSIFGFQSRGEYEPYRMRATSDAYYVGTDGRDYIVLPSLGPAAFATAAHEFAHLLTHAAGAHVPPWLGEGLADVFSTIRFTRSGVQLGGDPMGRIVALRNRRWLPLETLLALPADAPLRNTRAGADIFYAQSWALTEMLLMSPAYAPNFTRLVAALSQSQASSAAALAAIYGKPLPVIIRDLQAWVRHRKSKPMLFAAAPLPDGSRIRKMAVPEVAVETRLAAMLLAAGDLASAESIYRRAATEVPGDPSVLAGLAAVALAKGNLDNSLPLFAQAIARGIPDATLCYHYAMLLDRAGGPASERRAALARAIELQPSFDDARYALGLLEKSLGNDATAVAQLRAIRHVAPARAYHYWLAMADALLGAGRNEDAAAAANQAADLAADPDQRAHAAQLKHMAQTHLAVRLAHDSDGRLRLVTARAPNDGSDWNPFIEPTDQIRRIEGKLVEVDCSGPVTRMIVESGSGRVVIAIPDPAHVQMRHAPPEFVCGPQAPAEVAVQYDARPGIPNADGIARGIEFQ